MNKKIILLSIITLIFLFETKATSYNNNGYYIGLIFGQTNIGIKKDHFVPSTSSYLGWGYKPLLPRKGNEINNDKGNDIFLEKVRCHNENYQRKTTYLRKRYYNFGFSLGYGFSQPNNRLYLGYEIFSNKNFRDIKIISNNSVGITAIIGGIFNDYLIFLKEGFVFRGKSDKGFLFGIGADHPLNYKFSLGVEFIHERYSKINKLNLNGNVTYIPTIYTSNIRLKYKL